MTSGLDRRRRACRFACAAIAIALAPGVHAAEPLVTPAASAAADIQVEVHADQDVHVISPLIYGVNGIELDQPGTEGLTFFRIGGNRMTGYNWETNASNAGSDYRHQNDAYLSSSTVPGAAVISHLGVALSHRAYTIVSVPMAGYVAGDEAADGDIGATPDFVRRRLARNEPKKPGAFSDTPDLKDGVVYQDEFIHHLETVFPKAFEGQPAHIFFELDNEPDLWASTHPRLRGSTAKQAEPLSYQELFDRSTALATAIKAVAPNSLVFGPVNYGWNGMVSLQGARDGAGRDFLDTYLDRMRAAETKGGVRLLDVLDVHWYPEDRAGGVRITEADSAAAVAAARLQAPRSLWDPTFVEPSWIGGAVGAVQLIPRLKAKINAHYPGTGLAITEYNYGGADHISGGVAEADALGIFGRDGLFAASLWPLSGRNDYALAGFAMFRNYDGEGGRFGDLSVRATVPRPDTASAYASLHRAAPERMTLVLINKATVPKTAAVRIWSPVRYQTARPYSLTGAGPHPHDEGPRPLDDVNLLRLTLPPVSVTTVALTR